MLINMDFQSYHIPNLRSKANQNGIVPAKSIIHSDPGGTSERSGFRFPLGLMLKNVFIPMFYVLMKAEKLSRRT